jgi:hypothetical protein
MGKLPINVGTAIAAKEAQSMGNAWLKAPVISKIRIIPVTGQEVATVLHQAGSEAALPKRVATLAGAVDVLHVALDQVFHE